ncbi:EsaB/YukD family protein [Actinomyces wuliandei]|uniref:EsaB/YukD family protein n=1 Tax=Actinomyces wuliandei TaxID=2057743 RepID=UPI000FD6C103|nr:EsaB/YukD family protein [Actinomyces wuliandei]
MIPYTRVTVVSEQSRAEAVLPSDEPVGVQLPGLLALLGLSEGSRLPPVSLVRADGRVLEVEQDLDTQDVLDGEVLRVVPDDEVPPPVEVSDVSGALAQATDEHPWRWSRSDRVRGTGALLALATAVATWGWLDTAQDLLSSRLAWVAYLPGLSLLFLAASLWLYRPQTGRADRRTGQRADRRGADQDSSTASLSASLGTLTAFLSAGLLLPVLYRATVPVAGAEPITAGGPEAALLVCVLCLGTLGAGLRRPGWVLGAAACLVLEGLWTALGEVSPSTALARGGYGLAALVLLGALPWLALMASGISRLDNDALAGTLPPRHRLARSTTAVHDLMATASIALSVSLAWAATDLAHTPDGWARALAGALTLGMLLRSRSFPLRHEVLTMWLACAGPVYTLSATLPSQALRLLVLLGGAGALAALSLYQPTPHTRIRLRRAGDVVETLATVAALPLLCGLAGLFTQLLEVFA